MTKVSDGATMTIVPPRVRWNHAGWAMGNAGIIRELLRYTRLSEGHADGHAVPWPDHPVAGTAIPADFLTW